ncbi:hypothetical protein ABKN59_011965, partial [Abortiporus biennis]
HSQLVARLFQGEQSDGVDPRTNLGYVSLCIQGRSVQP